MTRPDAIPPGRSRGGIVIRIYRATDDTLLRETRLSSFDIDAIEDIAETDWHAVAGADVVVMPYDGDTGTLLTLPPLVIQHFEHLGIPFIGWGRDG